MLIEDSLYSMCGSIDMQYMMQSVQKATLFQYLKYNIKLIYLGMNLTLPLPDSMQVQYM